jgi:DNA-binding PadR family transcriptional regulator
MRHGQDGKSCDGPEGRGRGPRGRRPFDYGELRLLVLGMLAERPAHGYEIMKAIEARMGGGYSPSPGVIYPTLAWLEDMGFTAQEAEGGRKSFRATPEGEAFLAANKAALADLTARISAPGGRRDAPEPVVRGMDALKRALRARFLRGEVDEATIARIKAVLEAAARDVETS